MKSILACAAKGISVDQKTNNVSIYGLLEQIQAKQFPFVYPEYQLLFMLEKKEEESSRLNFFISAKLNGNELFHAESEIDFSGKNKVRIITTIYQIPISEPGILEFSIANKITQEIVGQYNIIITSTEPIKPKKDTTPNFEESAAS